MVQPKSDPQQSVEEAFFRTVAVSLRLPESWKPRTEELDQLRTRLLANRLSEAEAGELARLDPSEDRLARALTLRATVALADLTRRVAAERGLPLPERLPEALVVRGREGATSTRQSLEKRREGQGAPDPDSVPTLVVADDEAFAEFTRPVVSSKTTPVAAVEPSGGNIVRGTRLIASVEEPLRIALSQAESSGLLVPDPMIGRLLGNKYLVKQRIGKGGFGTVYLAEDKGLGAQVAVKVLNPPKSSEGRVESESERAARAEQALEGFFQEAKLLTTLDHPNIVRWITFDRTESGQPYFVMEYVKGKQLDDILKDETLLPHKRAAEILLEVVAALQHAHGQGLLHLDLKPNNVFVLQRMTEKDPGAKVIDFGISQSVGAAAVPVAGQPVPLAEEPRPEQDKLERSIGATVTGELLERDRNRKVKRALGGTLLYASPEQCEHLIGKEEILELDGRSDLYSLGVMAFRMLTGRFPFDLARTETEAIRNHLEVPPCKTGKAGVKVPRRLAAFVDRCLEKDREKRWPDAAAASSELDEIVHPRAKVLPIAAGLVVVFGGVLAYVLSRDTVAAPTIPILKVFDTDDTADVFEVSKESAPEEDRIVRVLDWMSETNHPPGGELPTLALVGAEGKKDLPGWREEWTDDGEKSGRVRISIEPDQDPEETEIIALLQLKSADKLLAETTPFRLRFIDRWEIGESRVQGFERDKLLSPGGQKLTVLLEGKKSALDAFKRAKLSCLGDEVASSEEDLVLDVDRATLTLPLDRLTRQPEGEASLLIEVWDDGGHRESRPFTLNLCKERIQILDPGFRASQVALVDSVQGKYPISPELILFAKCTRPGKLTIQVQPELSDQGSSVPALTPFPVAVPEGNNEIQVALRDLGLTPGYPPFTGQIVLRASDDGYVYPDLEQPDEERLNVSFEPRQQEVSTLADDDGIRVRLRSPPDWNYLAFPDSRTLPVFLQRTTDQDIEIESTLVLLEQKSVEEPQKTRIVRGTEESVRHELRAPGAHRLVVRTFPWFEATRGNEFPPREYLLYLEDKPPTIEPSLVPRPIPIDGGADMVTAQDTTVRLMIRTASPLEGDLEWEVVKPNNLQDGGTIAVPMEAFAPPQEEGVQLTGRLGSLFQPSEAVDGPYSLKLTARNKAGPQPRSLTWQIAYRPPDEPKRIAPAVSSDRKLSSLKDKWELTVFVRDPNGIKRVDAWVEREGEKLELGRLVESGLNHQLEHPPAIEPEWSEREVTFHVRAEDMAGNWMEWPLGPFLMPLIEVQHPASLVARDGRLDSDMALISGNREEAYEAFGSRTRILPDEKGRELRSLVIKPRELRPFYLDVTEVTRAQFRAFLVQGKWPEDLAIASERRASLLQELANPDHAAFPMTDVTLLEASAFALSHGKRLPTLLEWEYTVRGGEEYRRHTLGIGKAIPEGVNVASVGAGAATGQAIAARNAGADRCLPPGVVEGASSQFLWNLASNVREWTWSHDPTPKPMTAEDLLRFVAPDPQASLAYYYIVGASFRTGDLDYKARQSVLSTASFEDVGFRCAVTADEAQPLIDAERYDASP